MNRITHLGWMLGIGLCSALLPAETAQSGQAGSDAECGEKIRMKDVIVLDLEHLRGHPEKAHDFVVEHAGEYRLAYIEPKVIRTNSRPSRDPDSVIRRARKLGATNGCDLVLVLKTGPYFGRQGNLKARMRELGYAFVVMGQRIAGKP